MRTAVSRTSTTFASTLATHSEVRSVHPESVEASDPTANDRDITPATASGAALLAALMEMVHRLLR
jgi:hypothetical protein